PSDSSYVGHLMILPTGQIMFTDFSGTVEIYTPASGIVSGVAPTITSVSSSINSPSTDNSLSGTQLNGLTQNNAYGDDYQGDTDYPLVKLVEVNAPNTVYFATTHNETTHSIAPSISVTTEFDVPTGLTAGSYNLYVITNGIASAPVTVTVVASADFSLTANPTSVSIAQGGTGTSTITVVPENGFSGSVTLSASGLPSGVTAQFSPNPATSTSTLTLTVSGGAATGTSTVTITGNATLDISSITTSGDFALVTSSKPCGSTLAPGTNCKIEVTFTPLQVGALTGTVSITDNAPGSPQTVPLSGTGTAQATLTPATWTFATTKVGATSKVKVFTLANKQSVAL